MIVTFSKEWHRNTLAGAATVMNVVDRVSVEKYRMTWEHDSPIGNLYAAITWEKGRRVRFTIETRDAWKHGSRTSAAGRHMRKASWEAHRDVMRALLAVDPEMTIKTGFATYRGADDFEVKHEATAHRNVGSIMQPVTIRECSVMPGYRA